MSLSNSRAGTRYLKASLVLLYCFTALQAGNIFVLDTANEVVLILAATIIQTTPGQFTTMPVVPIPK